VALLLAVLALGGLALTGPVTRVDLHADTDLSQVRSGAATTVATGLTDSAQAMVGALVVALVVAMLLLRRRRWDAVFAAAVAGAAWTAGEVIKKVIGRPRPPASLWVMRPDSSGSFPSGHTVTAVVMVLVVLILARSFGLHRRLLVAAGLLAVGAVYVLAVGVSRLYLGDHYPTDVLGSYLTVAASTLLVWAAAGLRVVRRLAGGRLSGSLDGATCCGGSACGWRRADLVGRGDRRVRAACAAGPGR
jgi:undecaprenyl-diphosphatase